MADVDFCRELLQLKLQYSTPPNTKHSQHRNKHGVKGHTKGLTSAQLDEVIKSRISKPLLSNTRLFVIAFTISLGLLSAGLSYILATPPIHTLDIPDNVDPEKIEDEYTVSLRQQLKDSITGSPCLLEANQFISEIARPIYNCSLCENLEDIRRVPTMSSEEFTRNYAYNTVPIVITGEIVNWKAMKHFNYQYFKNLYNSHPGQMDDVNESCGYFAWNSDVPSLGHVFNMSDERARLDPGQEPWYIGWANCHQETSVILREMYSKPSFLPKDSESSTLDWIFMGWPGMGAYIHLDSVIRPSWQAQISGRKTWTFEPVPECRGICKPSYKVTVEKGEIIVFDSNQWYHGTHTEPGDISITIGSEFD